MVNLETLTVLHISRGSYSPHNEIIYKVDTDYIPGKDFPKIFDEKVRVILDMIIDDAQENEHFMRTRVFSTGNYSNPFRDSIEEIVCEANRQKRALKLVEQNELRNKNLNPFFYGGMALGIGIGYLIDPYYGTITGAGIAAIGGISLYLLAELNFLKDEGKKFPLADRAEDYERLLRVLEVRRWKEMVKVRDYRPN